MRTGEGWREMLSSYACKGLRFQYCAHFSHGKLHDCIQAVFKLLVFLGPDRVVQFGQLWHITDYVILLDNPSSGGI